MKSFGDLMKQAQKMQKSKQALGQITGGLNLPF